MTYSLTQATTLSRSVVANLAGLFVFGLMIVVQIAVGVDVYPTVPPGLVISVLVVALVLLMHRFWALVVAALWPTLLVIGALVSGGSGPISTPDDTVAFISAIVQFGALAVAFAAGWVAVVRRRSRR